MTEIDPDDFCIDGVAISKCTDDKVMEMVCLLISASIDLEEATIKMNLESMKDAGSRIIEILNDRIYE